MFKFKSEVSITSYKVQIIFFFMCIYLTSEIFPCPHIHKHFFTSHPCSPLCVYVCTMWMNPRGSSRQCYSYNFWIHAGTRKIRTKIFLNAHYDLPDPFPLAMLQVIYFSAVDKAICNKIDFSQPTFQWPFLSICFEGLSLITFAVSRLILLKWLVFGLSCDVKVSL